MKYNDLNVKASKKTNRVGRGISAGQGKTAGRGTKGQKARAGSGAKPGFEGGQNPLMARLPKLRGFTSHRHQTETIYTGQLNLVKGSLADNATLAAAGVLSTPYSRAKLILKGKLDKKVDVKLQAASAGAIKAVEAAGGKFALSERTPRPPTSTKKAGKNT